MSLVSFPHFLVQRLGLFIVVAAMGVVFSAGQVCAAEADSPARKLGRGIANLSLGAMAIPSEVIATSKRSGPAVGATWGIVRGTGFMLATTVVGLWEVMTCPFATPPDYEAIIQPEFPWQRFKDQPDPDAGRRGRIRTARSAGR